MADNKIEIKAIQNILDKKFFIPSYQRGYRWTTQQVKELLEDIADFTNKPEKKSGEFYCLQPIVVKEMSNEEKCRNGLPKEDVWYEVIDGQQRLTTIYLILTALKDVIKSKRIPSRTYEMRYERELSTAQSLAELGNNLDYSSIDRYHISNAFIYINKWADKNAEVGRVDLSEFCTSLIKYMPDVNDSSKDLANNVRLIWYEAVDEDPISVFTRLNIGKISLTNAELIKALILNRNHFKESGDNLIKLRQQEIASEWDFIENTLQDNSFWGFLHNPDYDRPTRIDFIFDLIRERNALNLTEEQREEVGNDDYRTFRYFYIYFKNNKPTNIDDCWKKVKEYFQAFKEWYNDAELYHHIGYLLVYSTASTNIATIYDEWKVAIDKTTFKATLKKAIKSKIGGCSNIDKQYKVDGSDKGNCKPLLLFHNIQTAINRNKINSYNTETISYRFPFDAYKLENWDVEHINSNTTNPEEDENTRKEWLVNVYLSVSDNLKEEIENYFAGNDKTEKELTAIFEKVKMYIPKSDEWTQQDKNKIWNYTLLDSSTNRSYGNAIFSAKRRVIIGKDSGNIISIPVVKRDENIDFHAEPGGKTAKGVKTKSCFVPIVTKQIFMKYYSPSVGDNNYWSKADAEAYRNDIEKCIKQLD